MITTPIFKGDITKVDNIKVKGETDYTLYSCTAIIVAAIGDAPLVSKIVAPDTTDGFDVYFTPQETDVLPIGEYIVVYQVIKTEASVITYRKEAHKNVRINADGITNT